MEGHNGKEIDAAQAIARAHDGSQRDQTKMKRNLRRSKRLHRWIAQARVRLRAARGRALWLEAGHPADGL